MTDQDEKDAAADAAAKALVAKPAADEKPAKATGRRTRKGDETFLLVPADWMTNAHVFVADGETYQVTADGYRVVGKEAADALIQAAAEIGVSLTYKEN